MRTPRNYKGIKSPSKEIKEVLPSMLFEIEKDFSGGREQILQSWQEIIGDKFFPFTEAKSFENGILNITVKTTTLYSVLVQHEKKRLLSKIRKKFPNVTILNIFFKMG